MIEVSSFGWMDAPWPVVKQLAQLRIALGSENMLLDGLCQDLRKTFSPWRLALKDNSEPYFYLFPLLENVCESS
jgi:hypothetical protein